MNDRTRGWTKEEDEKLVAMASGGASAKDIGIALERSRNSICGRAWRIGVTLHGESKPAGKPRVCAYGKPRAQRVPKRRLKPRQPTQPLQGVVFEVPPPTAESVEPISWEALGDGCCKWPVGSMFCGAVAMPRKPYCPQHTYMSKQTPIHQPASERPRRNVRNW